MTSFGIADDEDARRALRGADAVRRVLEHDRLVGARRRAASSASRYSVGLGFARAGSRSAVRIASQPTASLEPLEVHVDPAARRARDDRALQAVPLRGREVVGDPGPQLLRLDQRELVRVAPLVQRVALERLADELLEVAPSGSTARASCRRASPTDRPAARGRARGRATAQPAREAVSVSRIRPSKSKRKARIGTAMQSTRVAILGVDVGGTFTDAVLVDGGRVRTAKVPTAARQEESVLAAARAVGAEGVERFAHGTTVATNALLERRGARTAFVANAGFEHLLHLRRQTRAHLYRLCDEHPEPLVPLERCHGVRGRLGPDGELEPLDLVDAAGPRRRGGGRGLPALRVPRPVARAGGRGGAAARAIPACTSSRRTRSRRSSASTSARRRRPPTRISRRSRRAICARSRRGARTPGCPEPLVMLSSGGVALGRRGGGASGDDPRLRAGRRRRRRGPRRAARRLRERDRVRHGRHVDRRLPPAGRPRGARGGARGRRPSDPAADGRPAHGRRGRRLARAARRGRRDPRRPGVGRRASRARVLRRAAAAPTVTDANLLLGRLPAELPGGLVLDRDAAARALGGHRPGGGRSTSSTRRCCARCASSRSSAGTTRATSRSSRSAAPARCTRARSPRSSASRRCSSRRRPASSRRSASSRATSGATASSRTSARSPRWATCRRRARPTSATAASRSS